MSSALDPDNKARDVAFLDAYSAERWECVLHYMVGSQQQEGISADAVRILLHAGLMKRYLLFVFFDCLIVRVFHSRDEEDGSPVITRQGFQFLLLDRQAQVWHFVLQYLDTVEQCGLDLAECLTFLFQISFSTLGKVCDSELISLTTLLRFLKSHTLTESAKKCEVFFRIIVQRA